MLATLISCHLDCCAGNVWAGIADHLEIHWPLFIICYVLSSLSRFSICLTSSFPVALGICVLTEMFAPPVMILMDAATMAASAQVASSFADGLFLNESMQALAWHSMLQCCHWVHAAIVLACAPQAQGTWQDQQPAQVAI